MPPWALISLIVTILLAAIATFIATAGPAGLLTPEQYEAASWFSVVAIALCLFALLAFAASRFGFLPHPILKKDRWVRDDLWRFTRRIDYGEALRKAHRKLEKHKAGEEARKLEAEDGLPQLAYFHSALIGLDGRTTKLPIYAQKSFRHMFYKVPLQQFRRHTLSDDGNSLGEPGAVRYHNLRVNVSELTDRITQIRNHDD